MHTNPCTQVHSLMAESLAHHDLEEIVNDCACSTILGLGTGTQSNISFAVDPCKVRTRASGAE